jgi:hypothetical protein
MDVVGPPELEAPPQRAGNRHSLDDRGRNGEADESEPEDRRKREPGEEESRRYEHEGACGDRHCPCPRWHWSLDLELARVGVRRREHRCRHDENPPDDEATGSCRELVDRRDDDTERQGTEKVAAVEPNRLGNELADRPLRRREWWRQGTVGSLRSPRHGPRLLRGCLEHARERLGQGLERTADSPARAVTFRELVRDRADLDGRDTGLCARA